MPTPKLTNEILQAAIDGFEAQKQRIDAQIAALRQSMSGAPEEPAAAAPPSGRKRRKMSAAGRKRIAEAQRKRWAGIKKDSDKPAAAKPAKKKRKLSPEGRRRIIEATKKRWAAVHAAAAKAEK
jgi:hypothetical protein